MWEAWLLAGEVAMLARRKPRERVSDLERRLFGCARAIVQTIASRMSIDQRVWVAKRMEPVDAPDALQPHIVLHADILHSGAWTLVCSARFAAHGAVRLAQFEGTLQPKSAKAKEKVAA